MKNVAFICFLAMFLLQSCDDTTERIEVTDPVATCENCDFTCLNENETDIITNDCIDNWTCSFKVTGQSTIDLDEFEGRVSGDKNVFQMINSTQGNPNISDDEFTNILILELEENQNSFSVEGSELANMKVHFRRVCFCSEPEFRVVTSGCIQGEKQSDGSWFIQGNVVVPYSFGDIEVKFDAQFVN